MRRIVEPEILDDLDPANPDAVRSRRDLRLINRFMQGQGWIVKKVLAMPNVSKVVELGAGDGALSNRLKSRMPECEVVAIDVIGRPETARPDIDWQQLDVMDYAGFDAGTVVVANLFMHHFTDEELGQLGEKFRHVRSLVFAEPHRVSSALWLGRLIFPVVNHVTRNDMMVSIRAGFVRGEMGKLFFADFDWREVVGMFGGLRMFGMRR